jgi:hypothetical protein
MADMTGGVWRGSPGFLKKEQLIHTDLAQRVESPFRPKTFRPIFYFIIVSKIGEPLWLSGKVVKNEKINEIQRTWVCSPPRATSLKRIVSKNSFKN